MMVGCKADLEDKREVTLVRAKEKAKDLFPNRDIKVIETSAKLGQNVVQVFDFAISEVFKARRKKDRDTPAVQDTSANCLRL